MHEAVKPRGTRFSTIALRIALVFVFAYLVAILISSQGEIMTKREALAQAQQQVQTQTAVNKDLQRTLESGDENAYIDRVAREKLGFALPDERMFVDMSGK